MAVVVVVGAQWGDEGKGKVVDLYGERAEVVARFGGGANAGHTLVIEGRKLVTHLIPSGVFHRGTTCVLGDGMVIDPQTLLEEIAACRELGLLTDPAELLIAERAHVILPYHREIEALRERARARAIGTTLRGIGPAYEAKAGRRGVRVVDLLHPERLRAKIADNLEQLAPSIERLGGELPDAGPIADQALAAGEQLAAHVTDVGAFLDAAITAGRNVLFEGAQGALLDVDHGTYPFVTSSSTLAAGACQGTGIGPTRIDRVIGIAKAYTTRVGGGPFPSELTGADGDALREAGGEYGATTGRPRRCGWLDVPALRHAIRCNGMDGIALTKLDVLSGRPEIQMCVGYELDGEPIDRVPVDADDVARVVPRYQTYPGFDDDVSAARSFDELPANARRYVEAIEELTGVGVHLVSVGPDREQTISRRDPFAPTGA